MPHESLVILAEASKAISEFHIPWDAISLAILGAAGVLGLLLVSLDSLADLRDKFVTSGFLSKESWLGRQLTRRKEFVLKELLSQIGFTEERRALVREAQSRAWAAERAKAVDTRELVEQLLGTMKRCMVEDASGKEFLSTTGKYYVDVMGAASAPDPREWDFAVILAKWMHILRKESLIPDFDVIVVPKNGNPTLAHHAATFYSTPSPPAVLVWKSMEDHSRVDRPITEVPHFLDFEGLSARQGIIQAPERKLQVIAVDDNFTSGRTLCQAIDQFNSLVRDGNRPFEGIRTAVALFAVNSDKAVQNFSGISKDFAVHVLAAVGPPQLAKLAHSSPADISRELTEFQQGFACAQSRKLT